MAEKLSKEDLSPNENGRVGNYCAIIYGGLPPEAKKEQALAFNLR